MFGIILFMVLCAVLAAATFPEHVAVQSNTSQVAKFVVPTSEIPDLSGTVIAKIDQPPEANGATESPVNSHAVRSKPSRQTTDNF